MLQKAGYKIKIINTINMDKSMHYNPFAYIHSEEDILNLANTIITNTKGDGDKSGEDFWVKAERLLSTVSNSSMKSIGYTDISIEYSSDNVNWDEEKPLDNLLKSDSSSYYLNNYSVSVKGGYYYRVSLNHYAEKGGLFGSSQSVSNTSNSVWID